MEKSLIFCSLALFALQVNAIGIRTENLSLETLETSKGTIIERTKGVVLVGSEKDVKRTGLSGVKGVAIKDLDIPGSLDELKARLEPIFLNKPLTEHVLVDLKKEILRYFSDHDRPIIHVEVPEQDVSAGVVQIVVIESVLGEVICQGNKHFSDALLKKYIRIRPGEVIRSDVLLSDVAFLNRNHFRRTDITLLSGKEEKTTDVVLVTKDRMTWRFYAGGDNTGNQFSGNPRWFTGFNWGNVFNLDHMFSYQYTTSTDFHKFQAHTFHYTIPTKYHHTAVVYGGFSNVKPNLSSMNKDVRPTGGKLHGRGFSSQASLRYEIPIGTSWDSHLLEFVLGFDYKHMNNNLEWISDNTIPIVFKSANLTQFIAGLNFGLENRKNKLSFQTDFYGSPGQMMGGGNNAAFNNIRNRAKNHYIYGRFSLAETYHMPKGWNLFFILRGQGASRVLLPSEQFALGGYDTVRGYDEREFNSDNTVLSTAELRCPSFSLFNWSRKKSSKDHLMFLIFADYARGWNYKSLSNEPRRNEWLASVGPGLRYTFSHYLNARVDWGFKLHKDDVIGDHYGKVHVSVIASY